MDQPDLVADVFETYTTLYIESLKMILAEGGYFDGCFIYGDMGYRNATLFSPAIYRELLQPQHTRLCRFLHDHGKYAILHSCGKVEALIPYLIEAGWDALQPIEAKTGMDVRAFKKTYGNQITFFGNIDVRKLSGTKADIKEEITSKLPIAMQGRRLYVPLRPLRPPHRQLGQLLLRHGTSRQIRKILSPSPSLGPKRRNPRRLGGIGSIGSIGDSHPLSFFRYSRHTESLLVP